MKKLSDTTIQILLHAYVKKVARIKALESEITNLREAIAESAEEIVKIDAEIDNLKNDFDIDILELAKQNKGNEFFKSILKVHNLKLEDDFKIKTIEEVSSELIEEGFKNFKCM
jgi:molecular chaperone GrpE (heat shock protein)